MSTAQLRREILCLREQRAGRETATPSNRVAFARLLGMDPDDWQERLLRSDASRVLLLCSRQTGKSTMAALIGLHRALTHPGALVLILAPAERQAKETFAKAGVFYKMLGHPTPADSFRKLGMVLTNGSRIEALPGTEKTIRGFSGATAHRGRGRPRCRRAVLRRPADARRLGWRADNALHAGGPPRRVLRGVGQGGGWERYEMPARECPRISASFLEEERRALPARVYRQEYECFFVETEDQVFSFEDVAGALDPCVTPLFGAEGRERKACSTTSASTSGRRKTTLP